MAGTTYSKRSIVAPDAAESASQLPTFCPSVVRANATAFNLSGESRSTSHGGKGTICSVIQTSSATSNHSAQLLRRSLREDGTRTATDTAAIDIPKALHTHCWGYTPPRSKTAATNETLMVE